MLCIQSTVPRDGLASTNSWLICCLLPSIRPRNSFVLAPIAILQKIELAHATFTVPVAALIVPFLAPCMLLGPVPELLASNPPPPPHVHPSWHSKVNYCLLLVFYLCWAATNLVFFLSKYLSRHKLIERNLEVAWLGYFIIKELMKL
jgi:hypothetical protein